MAFNHPSKVRAMLIRLAECVKSSGIEWYPPPDPRAHPALNGGLIKPWITPQQPQQSDDRQPQQPEERPEDLNQRPQESI